MAPNQVTVGSISIILWNANGLNQHRTELDIYLHEKRIDIALITETHLTPQSKFYIPGYRIYRTDHPDGTSHGGTAILIKITLKHNSLQIPITPEIQATAITLFTQQHNITFAAVYCPPRYVLTPTMFSDFSKHLGRCFVAGGDYNAKDQSWGSRLSTPRGRNLRYVLHELSLDTISPDSPTYWPTSRRKTPDLLDFFITKGLRTTHHAISTSSDLCSDHSLVHLVLLDEPCEATKKPSLINGKMDWDSYKNLLNTSLTVPLSIKDEKELENAVEYFTTHLQQAAWSSSVARTNNSEALPIYPQYIRDLIGAKRRARKIWQTDRLPSDKRVYNRINNELKRQIVKFKRTTYDNYIRNLTTDDGSLWRHTKNLTKHREASVPLRKEDDSWAVEDGEKSEIFAEYLSSVFVPHSQYTNTEHDDNVLDTLDIPLQLSLPPPSFTPSQVAEQIRKLPKRKAPGYDLINAEVLQQMPRKALVLLTTIYNAILRTTKFPIQWKYSQITMIHKPNKDKHLPSSYRPISLLPICSKIFESLLYKRLIDILTNAQIIPDHQFGFRTHHSTIHQLHRVTDFISTALEQKLYATGVFLDVAQAFDRVWHQGLLFKLKAILPPTYYLILQSFLSDRFFSVRHGSELSPIRPISAGVPQGSVLAPLLYIIYTHDIPSCSNILTATYADDTAILTRHKNPTYASQTLQQYLTKLHDWFKLWKIRLNHEKSHHITFTLRRETCPPVFLENAEIQQTDTILYLGLTFDRRMTWGPHITKKRKTLNQRLRLLSSLLFKRSKLDLRQKLNTYTYLLKPIWTYASQIYGTAKKTHINKLQIFQAKTFRTIAKAPW